MSKNSVFLDVDRSLLEKRLLVEETETSEIDTLFPALKEESNSVPWKYVQPVPGICVKTKTEDGDKVFINICHTTEIPKPDDVSEEELMRIWNSDEAPTYRLPLSLGEPKDVEDKSGKLAKAFDVAINTEFFNKVSTNKVFRNFLLLVVMEGLQDKYKLQIDTVEYTILKNRKVVGTLQKHRIEQRAVKKGPLIQELPGKSSVVSEQQGKEVTAKSQTLPKVTANKGTVTSTERKPDYTLLCEPSIEQPSYLVAVFSLPDVMSAREVTVDVGEDRIILESRRHNYLLDIFVPYFIDQQKVHAQFNINTRVLTLRMFIIKD